MIFIVDDDESVRGSLVRLMRSAGYAAAAFPAAEDFLRDVPDGTPGCVIIDVHLGGMDGLALQHVLSRRAAAPPVVMITADEEPELGRKVLAAGAAAFLRKPFDDSALLGAVERAIGRPAGTDEG